MSAASKRKAAAQRPGLLRQGLRALAAGALAMGGCILVFALLLSTRALSHALLQPFATVSLCVGGFVCAYALAAQRRRGGLACGAAVFVLAAGVMFFAAWGVGSPELTGSTILRAVLLLAVCCAGGYLGMSRAERRPAKH